MEWMDPHDDLTFVTKAMNEVLKLKVVPTISCLKHISHE